MGIDEETRLIFIDQDPEILDREIRFWRQARGAKSIHVTELEELREELQEE